MIVLISICWTWIGQVLCYLQKQRSWQCRSWPLQRRQNESFLAYLPTQKDFSLDAIAQHKMGNGWLKTRDIINIVISNHCHQHKLLKNRFINTKYVTANLIPMSFP